MFVHRLVEEHLVVDRLVEDRLVEERLVEDQLMEDQLVEDWAIGFITLLLLLPFLVLLSSLNIGGVASAASVSFVRHSLTMNLL